MFLKLTEMDFVFHLALEISKLFISGLKVLENRRWTQSKLYKKSIIFQNYMGSFTYLSTNCLLTANLPW